VVKQLNRRSFTSLKIVEEAGEVVEVEEEEEEEEAVVVEELEEEEVEAGEEVEVEERLVDLGTIPKEVPD
jgi:hypothetical protein